MSKMSVVDWQAVAHRRLGELHALKRREEQRATTGADLIKRELLRTLHAQCFSVSDERIRVAVAEVARIVADSIWGSK